MKEPVKLDERDARLLRLLDLNGRATLASLGKALRISKPAVKRRLERLESTGVIRRYIAIINLPRLGYNVYKIHLKLTGMDADEHVAFAKKVQQMPATGWVLVAIGHWDLVILLYALGASDLSAAYRELIAPVADKVARKQVSLLSTFTHFPHDSLARQKPGANRQRVTIGGPADKAELDELDLKLINALSEDGRASLVRLGARFGVAPKTVKNRMRRLEEERVILGYNAIIDAARISFSHHRIYVFLSDLSGETYSRIRGYISSLPETVLISESLGEADLDFDVKVPDTARLHDVVRELRSRFKEVIRDVTTLHIVDEDVIDYTPFL